ncbi:MAG: FKBP-type peptidyl-prolyl cis-trans isomerase [Duncaniella sp.]|nr:FKBP-type peptidyl-prolyl cis-trans isomerase [Muribaculum sp.]MCM1255214.1 FKBP-type peptidyl-prolyl cis-trans isomerase [Duncaniella sp.]
MKKIVMLCGAAAMMITAFTSCGNAGSSSAQGGFGDSLSVALGEAQGTSLVSEYLNLPEDQQKLYKKDDILRGVKQAIMTDTTQQGYMTGLSIGLQIAGQLMRYEQAGIHIDRNKVYQAYAKAFSVDSVSQEALTKAQMEFQTLAQEAQQKMMDYYNQQQEAAKAAKENAPEAKENKEKGEAYIKAEMAKDPSIKMTESGLAYKVINEGKGDAVGMDGRAKVKYTGKLIDGTEFDSNSQGVSFSPRQVVPGFGEGLAMMKEGAKYILYIPGNLGYGVDGTPDGKIGPNATLIFEVETSDVEPSKQ